MYSIVRRHVTTAVSLGALLLVATPAFAQWESEADMLAAHPELPWHSPYESDSAGRGWAYPDANQYPIVGAGGPGGENSIAARGGDAPEGIEPLERDLYTSDDFYIDRELWSDQRYFRCNSGLANESLWGAYGNSGSLIEDDDPATAPWGACDEDYPREGIVSPYAFDTAQAHYEALMAEADAKGGPTEYDWDNPPPNWSGRFTRMPYENWWWQRISQIPTILSLLTDDYQTRVVQEAYHQGNTNAAQWPSQYCWPEGMMRRWHQYAVQQPHQLLVTPNLVQWLMGTADNFLFQYNIGRDFNYEGNVPRLGQDVPRWYGESIGFWDGDALITWTSNVQGWVTHNAFEHSNQLQVIEILTPREENGEFVGLHHETIFYDAEALLQPVRQIQWYEFQNDFTEGDPYIFIECNQTIFPIDGRATPTSPGQTIEYTVPDRFGRPWAAIQEQYFEQDMERPQAEGLFGF
ncbi:MAG TPA: hypothetical protein VNS12_01590 [Pelagibacterium sp.]|uniref:hypothetical protein n=1 Tax=Pelagibacterium sp. TaxID=1967288 RepID=UPI002B958352|nr:hypothetical protein [Pelagibacterium sp.]HWJ86749.1 hypothetical protein [Pelagibacterium sp.]